MSKRYPRVGERDAQGFQMKRRTCQWCGAYTDRCVTVQVSIFRGDDEVYKCCKNCSARLSDDEILRGPARPA